MERTKDHQLLEIIVIAICAVICGADDWVEIAAWGNEKEMWLKQFLELANGIPSHDTFGRVFSRLDAEGFEAAFLAWVQAGYTLSEGQVVALDGKQVRRSHDRTAGKAAIYMVSAWASANHLTLGQRKVDTKSNEITAIPKLLEVLAVSWLFPGHDVKIDSLCPDCGEPISLAMRDGELLSISPPSVVAHTNVPFSKWRGQVPLA